MAKKIIVLVFVIMGLWSCSHDEGYGGLASISGKVYGKDYNSNGNLVGQGYLGGVKVYISKHGETNYFDSADSAYDGSFKFNYLHEGTYDLWAFGDCDSCAWDQVYVLKTIEITDKKQEVVTEDFVVSF